MKKWYKRWWAIAIWIFLGLFLLVALYPRESTAGEIVRGILGFFIVISIYLFPTIVAYHRKKKNIVAILVLNIFLGWTIIGWVLALVWALTVEH